MAKHVHVHESVGGENVATARRRFAHSNRQTFDRWVLAKKKFVDHIEVTHRPGRRKREIVRSTSRSFRDMDYDIRVSRSVACKQGEWLKINLTGNFFEKINTWRIFLVDK